MLSASDLFGLELKVRTHAESLRKSAEVFSTSDVPEVRAHAAKLRQDADEFDAVGNLLVGLQGDWDRLGPLVREGYKALMAEFARRKAAAAESKAVEAA